LAVQPEVTLTRARDAFARYAWTDAFELYEAADAGGALGADDLRALAEAAWWTGRHDACTWANERAFAAFQSEGRSREAATVALTLMVNDVESGSRSVAGAWLNKAIRLLKDEPDCAEKGHLELRLAIRAHLKGELDKALEHEERALEIGARFGDRDLQARALMYQGKTLLLTGQVDEGIALMEEGAAAAVGGELSPRATGDVYCIMIATCHQLADYTRAGEWTEAAKRWCDRQAISGFPGVCRVHRAEIMRLRGSWTEAEEEARRAHEELKDFDVEVSGEALYEVGEIRMRRGDLHGAQDLFREAHELGHSGQPGLALLALERGEGHVAVSLLGAVLESEWHPLQRARYLLALAEAAIAAGDLDTATAATEEMEKIAEGFGSEALHARASQCRGSLELARGDAAAAAASFAESWKLWRKVDAPFDAARARWSLGQAHLAKGDTASGLLEIRAAKAAFDRLGALPDAERCGAVLEAQQGETGGSGVSRAMVTFMFTDIVGSTSLLEAIGDESWAELRRWHDEALRGLFTAHSGREVDHAGDGFFVSFQEPGDALRCAIAIQQKLARHRREAGFAPRVRIGVHAGEAVEAGQGYSGRAVHEAARIGALGEGGEILASVDTIDSAGAYLRYEDEREVSLKGVSEPVRVASVIWAQG
jgi:class 3 adenylate cyclase